MRKKDKPIWLIRWGHDRYHMSFIDGPFKRLKEARAAVSGLGAPGNDPNCIRIERIGDQSNKVVFANYRLGNELPKHVVI